MDKTTKSAPQKSAYQTDLQATANLTEEQIRNQFVMEDGNPIRVPYKVVRQAVFTNVKHTGEFADSEHAARLQYRLMLKDAVLKARVHYIRDKILVIYNPVDADNLKEKVSLDEIKAFLKIESGVEIDENSIKDEPYDYYTNFYKYAFDPPAIREHPPYGYTIKEWKKMKPEWDRKKEEYSRKKAIKQEEFRRNYLIQHPDLAKAMGIEIRPEEAKKKKSAEKGFWFHGV